MVKLPEVVSINTENIDGKNVVKQVYADGSYGMDVGSDAVEIHYPDNSVRTFNKVIDYTNPTKETDEYYLALEKLPNGIEREWSHRDGKAFMYYEKLPNGEERTWQNFSGKVYLNSEYIPGKVTRRYDLTGSRGRRGRIIPGTEYTYLAKEFFANGDVVEYYSGGQKSSEKIGGVVTSFYQSGQKATEKHPDGSVKEWDEAGNLCKTVSVNGRRKTECLYYKDGVVEFKKLPNGDEISYYPSGNVEKIVSEDGKTVQTWYEDGTRKSEKNPNGLYQEWNDKGRIVHEKRADATVVDYKYDGKGNMIYHAVNGKEDTIKYLAMKKIAELRSAMSEKLKRNPVTYKDANGNIVERQTVEKLNKVQKAVQMAKAMHEVKASLKKNEGR